MTLINADDIAAERNLTLNPETKTYFDDMGNEYRHDNGQALHKGEVVEYHDPRTCENSVPCQDCEAHE